MIDYLTLGGATLHSADSAAGYDVTRIEGLTGLAAPKRSGSDNPDRHGTLSRGRFMQSKFITIEGEVWGSDILDAYSKWDVLAKAFNDTLRSPFAARQLKWMRPGAKPKRTNEMIDPSFETLAGWTPYGLATLAVDAVTYQVASNPDGVGAGGNAKSCKVTSTGAGSIGVVSSASPGRVAVTAGETITVAGYCRPAANVRGIQGIFVFLDAALTQIGPTVFGASTNEVLGQWTRTPTLTTTVPVGAVWAYCYIGINGIPGAGEIHNIDNVVVIRNINALLNGGDDSYFDGNSRYGSWNGPMHNSTSLEIPPGRLQSMVRLAGPLTAPLEGGAAMLSYQVQLEQFDPRAYSQDVRTKTIPGGTAGSHYVENRGNIETPLTAVETAGGAPLAIGTSFGAGAAIVKLAVALPAATTLTAFIGDRLFQIGGVNRPDMVEVQGSSLDDVAPDDYTVFAGAGGALAVVPATGSLNLQWSDAYAA